MPAERRSQHRERAQEESAAEECRRGRNERRLSLPALPAFLGGPSLVLRAAIVLTVSGCVGPPLEGTPIAIGSLARFEADVEPHLEARCAQGGCHGRPERPFALYAPGQWRRDPARTHLDEPLDALELERNARALAALGVGCEPDDSPALTKPLAIAAGGVWHGGGDVLLDPSDRAYVAIREWLVECARMRADGGAP